MGAERQADALGALAGGEMGRLIQAHDWSRTPLGPADGWPQSLKVAVRIMLGSRYPMFIWWGPQMIDLHNDAYIPMLGRRHPWALGRPAPEIWYDIWGTIRPLAEAVLEEGRACWQEECLLVMERNGYTEEAYFTFSYSPIPDDHGAIGGIFSAVSEDTQRVLFQRRMRTLRELAERTAEARSAGEASMIAVDVMDHNRHDLPFALLYLTEGDDQHARLAAAYGLPESSPMRPKVIPPAGAANSEPAWSWPLDEARRTGEGVRINGLADRLDAIDGGVWPEPPDSALVLPVRHSGQSGLAGYLVAGISPRRAFDDEYRGFLEMLASHIGTAIASAHAYEEERKRAEALAELDRAKTTFFSNVSHEFRTPLTLMLGPIEDVLADGEGVAVRHRERLEVAQRNALRMQKLVNTLLDFSRIEAGRVQATFVPVDLARLTTDLASNFRSACERAGLALWVDCPPLPEPVYVDRDMWEKVVLNLVSNAFKYTLEGRIEVILRAERSRAVLTVRDTGVGISPEHLPLLFERFHRIAGSSGRTQEGTGIGLALVKELVHLHGGEVHARSEPDRGSEFIVSLPMGRAHLRASQIGDGVTPPSTALNAASYVAEALRWLPTVAGGAKSEPAALAVGPAESTLAPVSASAHAGADRPYIVLADDNSDMREYITHLLADRYEVTAVSDGLAALAAARTNPPDLVLSDVMMPRLDGFGLLRALRADPATATVPVLLLSARAGEEAHVEGLGAGADDYLVKPFGARELLARVDSHLKIARMRREAEDVRHRSDQRIRSILESITDAFFALDRDWRFTYVNRQAEHLLGRTRDDLVGKLLWEEYTAALGTDFEVYYHRAMDENVTVNFETYYPPHERWYEVHAYPSPEGLAVYFRDANKRRRAEEALRESEARFRAVVESNMVGIGFWCTDGTITDANDTLLAIIGRTREEIASGSLKYPDITPPEYRAVDERAMREIAEFGSCAPFEKEYLRPDGSRVPIVVGAARLPHDATRGPFFALDIRDRKRAELALHEATATLRSFYDTSPVMMGVVEVGDDDIRHLTDNAATGRFFGVDTATLAGKRASELGVPLSYRLEWIRRYRESEQTGQPVRFDYPHDLPDRQRWVSAIVYCIDSLPGGRSRCSYVAEDVTDRKNVERALHRQSERLRLLWEAATVMLTTEDPDAMLGNLFARIAPELSLDTYFNFLVDEAGDTLYLASCAGITDDQARAISRLEFGQAICGKVARTRQPIVATHLQQSDDPMVQLARSFGIRSYACSPLLVEGRLYGTLSFASRERDEFDAEDIEFLRTVSHYVTVACERMRLVRQLRDQDRRKDEFLATLAHELRNPLAPLRTGLQVLRLTGDADDRRLALEMMERQLGQMVRLIDDLLDISRITRNRLELRKARIALASVIENAVETARPLIDSRGHTLLVKLPDEPVDLDADLTRLAQVFWNLLNNSAKYTDPGGRIELAARQRGDEVIVTVSDNGIGIPAESLPGLFTMFSQVEQGRDRAQGGLGIGLALVKGLVEMHSGRVEASSPGIGRGSTFTVHLPALPAREPAANGTRTPGQPTSGRRRVLIVDDNRDGAASLGMMLSLHGHDTRTAHDGLEAIELAEAFRPDLMLLDIGLPKMSGYDVCRRIRGEPWGHSIVIVAVTGWGQDEDRRRSQEVGFNQHILKPIDFPALEKLLASLATSTRPS